MVLTAWLSLLSLIIASRLAAALNALPLESSRRPRNALVRVAPRAADAPCPKRTSLWELLAPDVLDLEARDLLEREDDLEEVLVRPRTKSSSLSDDDDADEEEGDAARRLRLLELAAVDMGRVVGTRQDLFLGRGM